MPLEWAQDPETHRGLVRLPPWVLIVSPITDGVLAGLLSLNSPKPYCRVSLPSGGIELFSKDWWRGRVVSCVRFPNAHPLKIAPTSQVLDAPSQLAPPRRQANMTSILYEEVVATYGDHQTRRRPHLLASKEGSPRGA